jgi:Divergent InlB B-repeat domain
MDLQKTRKTATITLLISLILLTTNAFTEVHAKTYSFTTTMSPTEVNINQLATYTVTITNTADGTLGSAQMIIPTGFTVLQPVTILNRPSTWNYTPSTTTINLTATNTDALLQQGETIIFTFDAIAPASSGITTWTTEATSNTQGTGAKHSFQGEQPTVAVRNPPIVPPSISAYPLTINQDQVSVLSQLTGTSGGITPYTYQWLEALNGGVFSPVAGANGPDYAFSPTESTQVGAWSFKLNVTDSSSVPLTATSNTVNVIVNSALLAPEVTATPNPISQTQTSTLTFSPVTTGTSPYTYRWFQKAPGGDYTIVGEDSPSYTFSGSTTTGTWAFLIQVTDSTGASVNSSASYLTVNSAPTFTVTVTQTAHGTITPGTTNVVLGSDQSFTIAPDIGYRIANVFVDGVSVGAVTSYTFTAVTSDHTITANYAISNADTYFINVASSHGTPTPSTQVNAGSSYSASVTSPQGDTAHRWICTGYSIDGNPPVSGTSYTFTNIQTTHTITFNWQEQYHLTVTSSDGSTTGTGWYDTGTTTTVSLPSNIIITQSGTRQVFTGWTGDATGSGTTSNPIVMDRSKTATATWKTQYWVTYITSGNSLQVTAPSAEWVDSGTSAASTFPTSMTNSVGNTKNIFLGDNRSSAITGPTTVTGTYQTQYLVTFIQNGLSPDSPETAMTVQGETKTCQQLPTSIWINAGDSITFTYETTFEGAQAGKQYILSSLNSTSPLTIDEPTAIQANYGLQTISSDFSLNTAALAALLLSIPVGLTIPIVATRRKRKKKITPVTTEGGFISPNAVQMISRGGDSTVFIITANLGYKIADVIIDDTTHLGPERTYKFSNVTENHTIMATFSKNQNGNLLP